MVRGAAGDEDDASAATDGCDVLPQSTEGDLLINGIETTTHGVNDRLGLLEDFLLHEVVEVTLHDLLELELDGLNGADAAGGIILGDTVDVKLALVDVSDVVVLEVEDLLGMLDDSRWVGGEEELCWLGDTVVGQESTGLGAVEEGLVWWCEQVGGLLEGGVLGGLLGGEGRVFGVLDVDEVDLHLLAGADTDDEGRTLTGGDDFMGVVNGFEKETESTLEFLDEALGQVSEFDVWVEVVEVLCQFGDTFCVGFGLEAETLALEKGLEFLVISDDTVVDNGELPSGVRSVARQKSETSWFRD